MRNLLLALIFQTAFLTPAQAHEFWIRSPAQVLALDATLTPEVWIGEDLAGQRFPFQPRAYEIARWIGPKTEQSLQNQKLAERDASLRAFSEGLHILAVTSFNQRLIYNKQDKFLKFVRDIGAEAALEGVSPLSDEDGKIRETYRRLSKTLVHFGTRSGKDRRVGLHHEWVQTETGFQLFSASSDTAGQPAALFCRTPDGRLFTDRLRTDADGHVNVTPPKGSECLINTVFLFPPTDGSAWHSDWTSTFFWTDP
ncbi:hypothetical protein AIOL_004401 [Candidatus Rhodobacter oscarellae]|uniref:DUF4198 domain-containing protein n=1 Tax=Candidatus Rhodobacter oscarellae TaxID=1675527 RepID=A0A0J9ECH8_9RHOB|nr:hypothetical protein [Candidatus Rhodobacter lobularis]KMW59419.1 hypothetical protein AIOL_004401 [Candidatus Rhodobacter lobularis]